ncbi:hypothetical protein [Zobellella aerophila]|uniref:UbiC transcription regulator-associated domain-containing protein n=1 Tax=Zobellella aerophila TaxID=870480 RepID=A0ABP6VDZ8_9GAMM
MALVRWPLLVRWLYTTAARGEAARALSLAEGSPVLAVTRINYDREFWRHDAVRILIDSHVQGVGHP